MKKFIVLVFIVVSSINIMAQEVSITVNGGKLYGTLTLPEGKQECDVVLIIAGSGPTDRDGNSPLLKGKCNAYKMLAEAFAQNGIASLRFDKRSIGKSEKTKEADLTFDVYINDAVEWIKFLKQDKRFKNVIVAGHSEGSLIGMIASNKAGADKYISLCGPAVPIYTTLLKQISAQNPPKELLDLVKADMDTLKQGMLLKKVNPQLMSLFRPSIQPYMISWFKYDPSIEIAKLKIPILTAGGGKDLQVDADDSKLLAKASGNGECFILPNMTHVLKITTGNDREANMLTYTSPDIPVSLELIEKMVKFIKN